MAAGDVLQIDPTGTFQQLAPVGAGSLSNTGVSVGSYGDATHVGAFTVNAQGQLMAASSVAITGGGGSSVGYLGSAQITSDFSTANGTATQVPGLTATVTIPASVHTKITVSGQDIQNTTGNDYAVLTVWDGTVGSGTKIGQTVAQSNPGGQQHTLGLVVLVAPGAGAKTYNVGLSQSGGGTAKLEASVGAPALLLIEAI